MNNIEMQGDNILLKLKEKENGNFTTTSGKEKNLYEVVSKCRDEDMGCKCTLCSCTIGTLVIISEHTGDKVTVDGQEYKIVKPSHILAIYKTTNETN